MSRYDKKKAVQQAAPKQNSLPTAEELFAIAQKHAPEVARGQDRVVEASISSGPLSPLSEQDHGGPEILSRERDGVDEDVFAYSSNDVFAQVVKYLLLDLHIEDIDKRKEKAQRLFDKLTLLANGRNVHLLDMLPDAIEFALQHGSFDCSTAPKDRGEQHDDPKDRDNRLLTELMGQDKFNRLNDRARGYQCSPRSAFIHGIENALAGQML